MAYLGNSPVLSQQEYRNIDNISGSFNGSTTSFALLVNGVAPVPAPQSSNQCLISVNGVVQKPDDTGATGFRLSGGNIIFSSAPTGGQSFFGVILAGADYIYAGQNFPDGTVSAPSITFNQDLDTGFYRSGAGEVKYTANGANAVTFSSNGLTASNFVPSGSTIPTNGVYLPSANNVAIATNSTQRLLIDSSGQIEAVSLGTAAAPTWSFTTDPNTGIYSPGADQVAISTGGSQRATIDSSGRLLVGTSSVSHNSRAVIAGRQDGNAGGTLVLESTSSSPANGDTLGNLRYGTSGNTASLAAAAIGAERDGGTWTNNSSMPARLTFSTTADGASSPTERLRITSAGLVGIGTSSPAAPLHVSGTDDILRLTATDPYLSFYNGATRTGYIRSDATNSAFNIVSENATSAMRFYTNNTVRAVIDSSGRLGIGTTSPANGRLNVSSTTNQITLDTTDTATYGRLDIGHFTNGTFIGTYAGSNTASDLIRFGTGGTERARIDSSGRLLVGTSSNNSSFGSGVQIAGTAAEATQLISRYVNSSGGPQLYFSKSRSGTVGSNTIVQVDDQLGFIGFYGANGTSYDGGASIAAFVDATPGSSSDMPGRLVFSTTADGASSPTERIRISQNGVVTIKNGAVAEIGTLTDGVTITPDFAANCNFTVTLGGNRTLANPTNVTAGQSGSIFIIQDATGSRTLSWGSNWDWAAGTAPTLTTTANAVDRVDYVCRTATSIHAVFTANYS